MQFIRRTQLAFDHTVTGANVMERLAEVYGDRRLVFEPATGRTLTYRQASDLVSRWSEAIAARVSAGDRVMVATPAGYDQFLICLAVCRAGAIAVPVNAQMSAAELDHVHNDAEANLVIRDVSELDGPGLVIEPARPARRDVAALFYTSGTTGKPKGAALSHGSLIGQALLMALLPPGLPLPEKVEAVAALPLAHIMGFAVYISLAVSGVSFRCHDRFKAPAMLDVIEQERPSIFLGVPAMYRMLLEAGAANRDLSSVRMWFSSADVMPYELARQFQGFGATASIPGLGAVGRAWFVEAYGMVEVGGAAAMKVVPPYATESLAAVGFKLPGYQFKVVDESGAKVGRGKVGELVMRGPGVLREYWNAPEATSAVLDDDGWLRTGDLVRPGPAGSIVFAGRAKFVIKTGGYSVYPKEINQRLEEHPDVLEAAAVGLPDPKLGEVPAAAVRLRPGAVFDEAALVDFATAGLAHYKAPRRIISVDDLPRTGTEKVQAAKVVELFDTNTNANA